MVNSRSPDETMVDSPDLGDLAAARRLTVGVTGHRPDRLGVGRVAAVEAAVNAVLEQFETAARPLRPPQLRLVTSLAEGADGIATDCAAARGWVADVVLPFFRDDYAQDFPPGAPREAFFARLARCSAIMELPGDRNADGGHGVAYERAGRVVLDQSDILIAVWDGGPVRGRGGTSQIVAEAVLQGIPVVHVDPAGSAPPALMWDGLKELDLGQQTVETVARGDLSGLAALIRTLVEPPSDSGSTAMIGRFVHALRRSWTVALAYPLLLAVMGIRRLKATDFGRRPAALLSGEALAPLCASDSAFAQALRRRLAPRFAHADAAATRFAQLFRSVYVSNFVLAATAVILSLLGLALPAQFKPLLIVGELATIGTILVQTRLGTRAAWHRTWLDNRALAERLRCLAISAQLGSLALRASSDRAAQWVNWYARGTAREIGLPSVTVDTAYLASVRDGLVALIDDQLGYLAVDAARMHKLEHRLHLLGTVLFVVTALTCVGLLAFKLMATMDTGLEHMVGATVIGATIIGAALPAIGAAVYGIRMQGDFAGIAERSHALHAQFATLRGVIRDDALSFDTLSRRARRVTSLLTSDLASWLQTYHARPLALPG